MAVKKTAFLFVCVFFAAYSRPVFSINLPDVISKQKNIQIDISSLLPFYDTLPPDEKDEQLRDWALYGLLAKLNISGGKAAELFRDAMPMRYPYLKNSVKKETSPGRIRYLTDRDCVLVVEEDKLPDKPLIGGVFDKHYAKTNYYPELAHIYGYRLNPGSSTITLSFGRSIPAKALLSPEYGYLEREVGTPEDFRSFVSGIDDITSVRIREKSVVFGGRKYSGDLKRALSVEDIASLYRAYNVEITPGREERHRHDYNILINDKYEEVLRNNRGLRSAVESGRIKRSEVLDKIRAQLPYTPLDEEDENVGFSLDPGFDFTGIADDLTKLSQKDASFVSLQDTELANLIDSQSSALVSAAGSVRARRNYEPVLVILRKYSGFSNGAERRFCELLKRIEMKNSYQSARYDGRLKGTSLGMILFYTDLMAKLWALDYNDTAPKDSVRGFRVMSEIGIPRQYWDDFMKLSKTRLWFGLRLDSFEAYDKKVLFEPVGTRVYAASSDPLYPGKESTPNYQSGEFLGWWDAHYQAIADYEPQYYKLNQVQKWSAVFVVLKEKKSRALDFLFGVPAAGNYDFEAWYRDNPDLKVRTPVAFLDRNKYARETECIPLLTSKNYPLMGMNFFLYGGVTLANKRDILQKFAGPADKAEGRQSGKTAASPARKAEGKPAQTAKQGTGVPSAGAPAKKDAGGAKVPAAAEKQAKPVEVFASGQDAVRLKLSCRQGNVEYGKLVAEKHEDTVKLRWDKSPGALINEVLEALVEIQQKKLPGYKDENIFKLVPAIESVTRVEQWKTYILKAGALKIHLNINKKDKSAGYIAEAAGTEPDSDIFYARFVK